ncbi:hypothetical protein [Xenorhabdus khoisanae]|uniref:hypothetical protein n=1 Tax=Xenorhabdus khoisanae TaxID=880157 RepID=UPI002358A9F9|nr:hypothetical protein [Xenorhabdus khoisanae]
MSLATKNAKKMLIKSNRDSLSVQQFHHPKIVKRIRKGAEPGALTVEEISPESTRKNR